MFKYMHEESFKCSLECNDAVRGDSGIFPIDIFAAKRCLKYWIHILNLAKDRYFKLWYEMLLYYDNTG